MLSPGLRDPEQELRAVSAATVLSPRAVERRQHERQVPAPEAPLVTVCVPVTSGPARENSFGRSGLSWASTGRAHGRGLRAPLPGGTAAGASEVLRVSHEHSGVAPGEVMAARTPSPYRRASFSPGSPHPPPPIPIIFFLLIPLESPATGASPATPARTGQVPGVGVGTLSLERIDPLGNAR